MPDEEEKSARARLYHRARLAGQLLNAVLVAAVLIGAVAGGFAVRMGAWFEMRSPTGVSAFLASVFAWHALLFLVRLPLDFLISYLLEKRFGLSEQGVSRWAGDEAKSFALSQGFSLCVAAVFYYLIHFGPIPWWPVAAGAAFLGSLFVTFIMPHVIVPLFYPMRPLKDEALRCRLTQLASRLGVRVRDICEIALSRKTRKANAAVIGIAGTRRIVLGDTLIAEFTPEEIEAVTAHELGHHVRRHVPASLLFGAVLSTFGLWLLECVSMRIELVAGTSTIASPAAYPVVLLAAVLFHAVTGPLQNAFSRMLERDADAFALKSATTPDAFIGAMRRLASQNLAETAPHPLVEFLFYTHPSIARRIRRAEGRA